MHNEEHLYAIICICMPCAKLCLFAVLGKFGSRVAFLRLNTMVFFSAAICYRQSSLFKIWTELTLVTMSRSFIISRHQIHKLKIWNHRFCSIPPFLATSVDKPWGRNNCMIWLHRLHQLQYNMSRFFFPSTWRWELRGTSPGGTREVQSGRSHRRYRRLLGISVLIHHWAEIWIIHQHVCGFILSERPRAWRKPEFGCGGKKNTKIGSGKLAGSDGEGY